MNYIWSKKSLLEFIENSIAQVVDRPDYTFSDLFAGTGIVGRFFKQKGHKVIANDLQYYSYVLNQNYIGNHTDLYFSGLISEIPELLGWTVENYKQIVIDYLDQLDGVSGFIYQNYALWGTQGNEFERQYFSDFNAQKADAIRTKIEQWHTTQKINDNEYYFLLASLLESIDKVANTASVYGAFLKKLKKSAQTNMKLQSADFLLNHYEHHVYNEDINQLIQNTAHDVVYLDPPYNARQYSSNYHILETIARYDSPKLKGKTWMRDCTAQSSLYCKKNEVKKAFSELINTIQANYIFLSYNSDGLMILDEIKEIMSKRWEYGCFQKPYKRFKADKNTEKNYNETELYEYLHYVKIKH